MALWQISFYVILKVELNKFPRPYKDEDGLFDDSQYWKDDVDPFIFKDIANILPETKSWSEDIVMYRNLESNVFEIGAEAGKVEWVSFRIDFTSDYEAILRAIVEFCLMNGLAVLTTDLENLPLNFETINQHIIKSPQVVRYKSFLS